MNQNPAIDRVRALIIGDPSLPDLAVVVQRAGAKYSISDTAKAADILHVWQDRAKWNRNPANSVAGRFSGMDTLVQELSIHPEETVRACEIRESGRCWTVFITAELTRILAIVSEAPPPDSTPSTPSG